MLDPVDRLDPRLAVADRRIVDHGVEASEAIGGARQLADLRDAREVAGEGGLRPRRGRTRISRALLAASVKRDLVPLVEQQLRGHQAEPVGGSGNQHARHELDPGDPVYVGVLGPEVVEKRPRVEVRADRAPQRLRRREHAPEPVHVQAEPIA